MLFIKSRPSLRIVLIALSFIAFTGTIISCKKNNDPLKDQTSLLINKKWDLVSYTITSPWGEIPVRPDTTAYWNDNYFLFTDDGRYVYLDGLSRTPGTSSDTLQAGHWDWLDANTLHMVHDLDAWVFHVTELTETDLRYEQRSGEDMNYWHYQAVP